MSGAVAGVVLAGGLSRRMGGGDKGLKHIGGRSILDRVIARLAPQVGPMALNANGDPARFAHLGLPVIADSFDGYAGPLAGVLSALDWAAGLGRERVVTVAGDTPFFPRDLVRRFVQVAAEEQARIVLAGVADPARGVVRQPTFGLWPVELREDLRRALDEGTRKVVAWSDRHETATAVFDGADGPDPFFNINTPHDIRQAEALLKRA